MNEIRFDWPRLARTGVAEAVLADGKTLEHLRAILDEAGAGKRSVLMTRLDADAAEALAGEHASRFDYDARSRTAVFDHGLPPPAPSDALIVTAGTSDLPVAMEAQRTLAFHGLDVPVLADCGVAGLWRLREHAERLERAPAIIAVAGMEGALFPVIAGMTHGIVIALPTSIGYGVAEGGTVALSTALATCAPGVVTVNIDNGFGAASAMIKILSTRSALRAGDEGEGVNDPLTKDMDT